ncbi:hypothetical protein [Tardiphaga sp. 862_B3_N1_1]|uniref:hypothetical protein n=1 Tax=Tardiphaga sp. 862_B3_N1_1 TaxID=3240763 RepID=UPI003F89EA0F
MDNTANEGILTPSVKALFRGAILSVLSGLIAAYYGAPTYKAGILGLIIFTAYAARLSRRHLERIVALLSFATLIYWSEMPALNRLVDAVYLRVVN